MFFEAGQAERGRVAEVTPDGAKSRGGARKRVARVGVLPLLLGRSRRLCPNNVWEEFAYCN